MLAILNLLNAHNLPIFQPILMILVSKFIVHRALSDKNILIIRVAVPFNVRHCRICTPLLLSSFVHARLDQLHPFESAWSFPLS